MDGEQHALVISLVERGWQAARECTRELPPAGGTIVVHIVKGWVSRSVRRLLLDGDAHLRLISVPRRFFWIVAWSVTMASATLGRRRVVLVDNERSLRRVRGWTRWLRCPVVLVHPSSIGADLLHEAGIAL